MIKKRLIFLALLILIIIFTLLGTLLWSERGISKKWIAVGDGDVTLAFSSNGKKWTGVEGLFGDNEIGQANSVHRFGDRWVVVGRDGDDEGANIWWSDDAEIWNTSSNNDDEDDIFWGTETDNRGLWVTRGSDGLWMASGNGDVTGIYWSKDGKTWNESKNQVMVDVDVNKVLYLNNIWLATGQADIDDKVLFYSTDGKKWTAASSSDKGIILGGGKGSGEALAYHDGLWVMGGGNIDGITKQIWWSEDGKTWTGVETSDTFGTDGSVRDIIYSNGKWIATGDSNGGPSAILYSLDGKTWSEGSSNTSDHDLVNVVYSNGYFITPGQDNSNSDPVVFRSTDGINWEETNFSSGDNNILQKIKSDGSFAVLASEDNSDDNSLWYSENDGLDWKSVENNPFGVEGHAYDVIYR